MAPQGFPERDIALHAAVLSFPHPVRRRVKRRGGGRGGEGGDMDGKEEEETEEEVVVCVAPVPPHWTARYGVDVTARIENLCSELKSKYTS